MEKVNKFYQGKLDELAKALAKKPLRFINRDYNVSLLDSDDDYEKVISANRSGFNKFTSAHFMYDLSTAETNSKDTALEKRTLLVIVSCCDDFMKHRFSKYVSGSIKPKELVTDLPMEAICLVAPDMDDNVTFTAVMPTFLMGDDTISNYSLFSDVKDTDDARERYTALDNNIPKLEISVDQMKAIWQASGQKEVDYSYYYTMYKSIDHLELFKRGQRSLCACDVYSVFNKEVMRYAVTHLKDEFTKDCNLHLLVKKNAGNWWVQHARKINHIDRYNAFTTGLVYDAGSNKYSRYCSEYIYNITPQIFFNSDTSYSFYRCGTTRNEVDNYPGAYDDVKLVMPIDYPEDKVGNHWEIVQNGYRRIACDYSAKINPPILTPTLSYELGRQDWSHELLNPDENKYIDISPKPVKALPEVFNMITTLGKRNKFFSENGKLILLSGSDNIHEIDTCDAKEK